MQLDRLTKISRIETAMVELTTNCNLRCDYCAVGKKEMWQPLDFDLSKIDTIIAQLKALDTKIVILHGHGESTVIDDWHIVAGKFAAAGIKPTICTNLAKHFSQEELKTLARFYSITVSIDTPNPNLFKRLRKGSTLQQVIFNQTRIQSIAMEINNSIKWIWDIVICDLTYITLPQLVRYGRSLGVDTFTLCNLVKLPGNTLTKHISELPVEEQNKAAGAIMEVQKYCNKHNLHLDINSGLMDTLNERVQMLFV